MRVSRSKWRIYRSIETSFLSHRGFQELLEDSLAGTYTNDPKSINQYLADDGKREVITMAEIMAVMQNIKSPQNN